MPDGHAPTDQKTQIAVLIQQNKALTDRVKILEVKVAEDGEELAEFRAATRTGKWILGVLIVVGMPLVTYVLSRSGTP